MKASLAVRTAAVALTAAGALSVAAAPAHAADGQLLNGSVDTSSLGIDEGTEAGMSIQDAGKFSVVAPWSLAWLGACGLTSASGGTTDHGCLG